MNFAFFNTCGDDEDIIYSFLIIEKVMEAFRLKKVRLHTKKQSHISFLYPEIIIDPVIPAFLQQKRRRIDEQSFEIDGNLFLNTWTKQLRNQYVKNNVVSDGTIISIATALIEKIALGVKMPHNQVLPRYFQSSHKVINRHQTDLIAFITPLSCRLLNQRKITIRSIAGQCVPMALLTTQKQILDLINVKIIPSDFKHLSSVISECDVVIAGSQLDALFLGCGDIPDPPHVVVIGEPQQQFFLARNFIVKQKPSANDIIRILMKLRP